MNSRALPRPLLAWLFIIAFFPIIGSIYPPESYFSQGILQGEGDFSNAFIMAPLLLIMTFSMFYIFWKINFHNQFIIDWPIAILITITFIASILSSEPGLAINRSLRLLPAFGYAIIFSHLFPIRTTWRIILCASIASAIGGICISLLVPKLGLSQIGGAYDSSWRGLQGHKNFTGFIFGISIILSVVACQHRLVDRRMAASAAFFSLIMIVAARSATAMLATAAALLVINAMAFAGSLRTVPRLFALAALAALLVTVTYFTVIFPETVTLITGRDLTLTGRTEIWAMVSELIRQSPWTGHDFPFWSIDSADRSQIWHRATYNVLHSHNSWLDLVLQLGLPAAILVGFDLSRTIVISGRQVFNRQSPSAKIPLGIAILVLITSASEVLFSEPGTAGIFWLTFASILARRTERSLKLGLLDQGD